MEKERTTIRFPKYLMKEIDTLSKEMECSRNTFVLNIMEQAISGIQDRNLIDNEMVLA